MDVKFGERLKYLREKNNYTQKDLAKSLHIGDSTLSNYEKNKRMPNIESIISLCEILNCSSDYLLGLSNSSERDIERSDIKDFLTSEKVFFDDVLLKKEDRQIILVFIQCLINIKKTTEYKKTPTSKINP